MTNSEEKTTLVLGVLIMSLIYIGVDITIRSYIDYFASQVKVCTVNK